MSVDRFFGGRVMAGAGALCGAVLGAIMWSGAEADTVALAPAETGVVRVHDGYGYVPHDAEAFDSLALELAALPEDELAQMASFAEALAADLDQYSSDELAGRIGDLLTVVDLAYADRQVSPAQTGYDADALREITDRIGYDTKGLTGG